MKKIFALIVLFQSAFFPATAQNVGIGTTSPVEKLDVNGPIKIGDGSNANPGTIRWNAVKNDFEGFNGTAWVSLTGGKSLWGSQESYATENNASQHALNYNGTSMGTRLGESVAIDNGLVAAGASHDFSTYGSGAVPGAGTVHLYKKSPVTESWSRVRTISNPTPQYYELFGNVVDIHNNQIVVGAYAAQINNVAKGEAYIFQHDPVSGNVTLSATLAASDGQQNDLFGYSAAVHNNIVAVGAPGKDVLGLASSGGAYVFAKTGNTWTQIGNISPADRVAEDHFGTRLSLNGSWLAVSAPRAATNGVTYAGKVYLYKQNAAGIFVYHSTLTAPDPVEREGFGGAVQITGDTLVVGANQYESFNPAAGNGRVLIYIRNGDTWQHQQTITASDGKRGDAFGKSVHLKNGQLIVGAYRAWVGSNDGQGKAYMFKYDGNSYRQQAIFTGADGSYGSNFGWDAITDCNEAVISANNATYQGFSSHGRIYFFRK